MKNAIFIKCCKYKRKRTHIHIIVNDKPNTIDTNIFIIIHFLKKNNYIF